MAVNNLNKRVAYGLTDPLLNSAPLPIVSQRAPTANDKAEIGTEWIDQPNDAVYILTSIVANMANWEPVGGGSLNIETLTGDSGGAIAPVAGNIDILGSQGSEFTGTAGTLTQGFLRLELGTLAVPLSPASGFSSDLNTLQVYSDTSGGADTNSYNGATFDLLFATGDGTPSGAASKSLLTIAATGNVANAYGAVNQVIQSDNGIVATGVIGVIGSVVQNSQTILEMPATYMTGVMGQLIADAAAAVPPSTHIAGIIANVGLDAALDGIAHGVLVARSGAGAGVAAGSAFKIINSGAVDNWSIGLDLYNESVVQDYGVADLRFWNQSTVVSAAGNVTFAAVSGADWVYVMGDAAGVNEFRWEDSANVQQMALNSDGVLLVQDDISTTAGSVIVSTVTEGITFGSTCRILSGTGSPNGAITAPQGSLFLRTDGSGVNDRAYINTDGVMAWTAIVTVA